MKRFRLIGSALILLGALGGIGCGSLLPADLGQPYTGATASRDSYGLTAETPIPLGTVLTGANGRAITATGSTVRVIGDYFQYLVGPHGEPTRYKRIGQCCPFPSPKGDKARFLEKYDVYRADGTTITMYFNLYAAETPRAPAGFVLQSAYFEAR